MFMGMTGTGVMVLTGMEADFLMAGTATGTNTAAAAGTATGILRKTLWGSN
jgi:hypothetical protein